jgi:hypothetical protein
VEQLDVGYTLWARDSLGAGFSRRSLSLKKNPLIGEVEVREFSKSVGDFLLLMKTVRTVLPHRLSFEKVDARLCFCPKRCKSMLAS